MEQRIYRAVRTHEPMDIDGHAKESVWKKAAVDDRFLERQPDLGKVPPVRTSVQVAYDDFALYVFIRAEAEPGDVVVRTLRRDNFGIFADDAIHVKIDPAHDHRTAYGFGINADGAQIDTLGLEDGRQFIREWDGVWEAETSRRPRGYAAEFKIPFAIIGIKSAQERTIGFNISRDHQSRNATYDWRLIVPPRSPSGASAFGDLEGLSGIETQRALEFTPYAVLRTNFQRGFTLDPRQRPNFATGGDVRLQVGAGSYVEASLLTDFAQVEADEVQVARDRFPLFFPERRPFFINGLDVFNFGREREAQLFFSRRVGLADRQPVPILAGAKAYGRAGPVSYGALHVQTLASAADESRGIPESPAESYTVGRVRVQATRTFNVGMMALGSHRFGIENDDVASGGVDGQVITRNGKLSWYGFVAGTYAQTPASDPVFDEATGDIAEPAQRATDDIGSSAYSTVEYRGLYVRPSVFWLWSDEDFDPRLGFYRRPGTARQQASLRLVPRPTILGIREIPFGPSYTLDTDPRYTQRLTQNATSEVKVIWRNGAELEYELGHFIDDVQDPFELYLYTIEAKRYSGFRHKVEVESPSREAVQAKAEYEHIELFGGKAHQPSVELTARIGKHFTVRGRYTHLVGHLEDTSEEFNFGFANGNIDIALTRNLVLDNLFRFDFSPGSERIGFQARLRWRFLPGSDLFLVYRTDQPLGLDPIGEQPRQPFHELTLKLTYYMRALLPR